MCEVNEQEGLTLDDMSKEQLIDTIEQLMDMSDKEIVVNKDDIQNIAIDSGKYKKGVSSMSYIIGQYSALVGVGIDSTSAIDIVVNERNIVYQEGLNGMTCENNLKIAKTQQIQVEQNQA